MATFKFSDPQANDIMLGIGAGLSSYNPNNSFAGAGAALSTTVASRLAREAPYRQMQAQMDERQMLSDMYKGKKATAVNYGYLSKALLDMFKQMYPRTAKSVGSAPQVNIVAEQIKAQHEALMADETLMRQALEQDPEWAMRSGTFGGTSVPKIPEASARAGDPNYDPNYGEDPDVVRLGINEDEKSAAKVKNLIGRLFPTTPLDEVLSMIDQSARKAK